MVGCLFKICQWIVIKLYILFMHMIVIIIIIIIIRYMLTSVDGALVKDSKIEIFL